MVIVDLEGQQVAGRRNVTSELGMHLLIYRTRPDIRAIVHAHPPTATGFAAAGIPLTEPLVCEVVMGLGCIPLARYGTPGTSELAQTLEPYVPGYDAILMSNHGVVAYGDTLEHAYMKMETVEHFAQIALVTHLLGRQQPLKEVEIEKLLMARTKYFGAKNCGLYAAATVAAESKLAFLRQWRGLPNLAPLPRAKERLKLQTLLFSCHLPKYASISLSNQEKPLPLRIRYRLHWIAVCEHFA